MKILLLITSIVLLSFCKNETTAGGSEIGSPTISGLLKAEDSSQGNARVRIFPHSYFMGMDTSIIVEGKTLSDGSFTLNIPETWRSCNLLVESETGMMAAYSEMSQDSFDKPTEYLNLKPGNSLQITLKDSEDKKIPNTALYFQGYPYLQKTDPLGKAQWPLLPEGEYQIFVLDDSEMKQIAEITMGSGPADIEIIWNITP